MPIYEFHCNDCGSDFEKLIRRISAIDGISCPECDSSDVHKKLSVFSSKVSGGTVQSSVSNAGACSPGGG